MSGKQTVRWQTLPDAEQTVGQPGGNGFAVAAQSLANSHSALGAYYRRMWARLGAPKAITATAHKLARLVYSLLRYGTACVDAGQQAYERQYCDRVTNLQRKAKVFGYQLVRVEDTDSGIAATL